ncbi:hypothetical protein GCM10027418_19280 [Mariniluteicoccus endophyticus]
MRTLARVLCALVLALTFVCPAAAHAYDVGGAIGDAWRAGARSAMGDPTGPEVCGLRDRGCYQNFQRGAMYWQQAAGAHWVRGAIQERWGTMRWENSPLRYPTTDERCGFRDGGCFNHFQGGSIYWSPASGAHPVWGLIRDRWESMGWERSPLAYPVEGERCIIRNSGCFQYFQGGAIYYSPATGAHPVFGAIFDHWRDSGWEAGRYGYPTGGEACRTEGGGRICDQRFEHGTITWRSDRGIVTGVDCRVARCVALTYDDGPSSHTSRLLDTLGREGVKATFFVVGDMVDSRGPTVSRAASMGMEIGNHTTHHGTLSSMSYQGVRNELNPTSDKIQRLTGRRPVWMRPPGGATSTTVQQASADMGMGVALWSVDPYDWRDRNAATVTDRVLHDVRPGAVVLMHDLHGTTVDAAPGIIRGLKAQGYTLVTMSELLGQPAPGQVYRSR